MIDMAMGEPDLLDDDFASSIAARIFGRSPPGSITAAFLVARTRSTCSFAETA